MEEHDENNNKGPHILNNNNYYNSDEDELIRRGNTQEIRVVERKPWRSFMMIMTMFTIISSLRMVYSTIASFLPHYI